MNAHHTLRLLDPSTSAVRVGLDSDPAHGSVMPPLHLSSNFSFEGFAAKRPYDYSRSGNPTRDLLAEALTVLEGGAGAVVTASGMAALDLVFAQVRPGQRIIAPHDCYGGSHRLLSRRADRGDFDVAFVDQSDLGSLKSALERQTALVLVETPSNPLLRVVDIVAVAELAQAAGAKVAVDNTFLSPALQQPIPLGADYVVHSTTKYINGHSDVVGGAVVAASPEDVTKLADWANTVGITGAPFDAYPAELLLKWKREHEAKHKPETAEAIRRQEQLQQHAFTVELTDQQIEAELLKIRQARSLNGYPVFETALAFAARVETLPRLSTPLTRGI
jgi:cystathionine gamma-synthase